MGWSNSFRYSRDPGKSLVVLLLSACAGCASQGGESSGDTASIPGAENEAEESQPILDRTRTMLTSAVTRSAQAIDNTFSTAEVDAPVSVARGRLTVGAQYDDYDGLDERVRFRARIALPALKDRFNLLVGRTNANEFVDGLDDGNIEQLPTRFDDYDDDDWILGIGYSRTAGMRRGWNFDAGIKLRTPLEPYVRANYYWNKSFGDRWLLRLRPRVFWQNQRGPGVSLQQTLDFAASDGWLIRSYAILVVDEEQRGVTWTAKLTAYQRLSDIAAFSYAVYANGQPEAEVSLQDYGVELRYRRQFLREWFYVGLQAYLNWPRELLIEERKANPGVGIEFEMQFGDWAE